MDGGPFDSSDQAETADRSANFLNTTIVPIDLGADDASSGTNGGASSGAFDWSRFVNQEVPPRVLANPSFRAPVVDDDDSFGGASTADTLASLLQSLPSSSQSVASPSLRAKQAPTPAPQLRAPQLPMSPLQLRGRQTAGLDAQLRGPQTAGPDLRIRGPQTGQLGLQLRGPQTAGPDVRLRGRQSPDGIPATYVTFATGGSGENEQPDSPFDLKRFADSIGAGVHNNIVNVSRTSDKLILAGEFDPIMNGLQILTNWTPFISKEKSASLDRLLDQAAAYNRRQPHGFINDLNTWVTNRPTFEPKNEYERVGENIGDGLISNTIGTVATGGAGFVPLLVGDVVGPAAAQLSQDAVKKLGGGQEAQAWARFFGGLAGSHVHDAEDVVKGIREGLGSLGSAAEKGAASGGSQAAATSASAVHPAPSGSPSATPAPAPVGAVPTAGPGAAASKLPGTETKSHVGAVVGAGIDLGRGLIEKNNSTETKSSGSRPIGKGRLMPIMYDDGRIAYVDRFNPPEGVYTELESGERSLHVNVPH